MDSFVEKIKKLFDEEIVKKNKEIDELIAKKNKEIETLNQSLSVEKDKLRKILEFIKDTVYEDSSCIEPQEIKLKYPDLRVRGFPSRAAGDPDDEFDSIRR